MKTDEQNFLSVLYEIQRFHSPNLAILAPKDEPLFEIDLNTREIHAPEIISVKEDHRAETIYFKVARYYDGIDLAKTCCIIQYINALGESRVYAVPYYDAETYSELNIMLFPWVIDGEATKAAGTVQYSVRFFKLNSQGSLLVYNLNTLPTTGIVEKGFDMKYEAIYNRVEVNAGNYMFDYYYLQDPDTGEYYLDTARQFDSSAIYYEKTLFDENRMTSWGASFLEQITSAAREAAEQKLTWSII